MSRRYTKEQHDYIREVAPGRYNSEIAALFNAKFGTDVKEGQIKSFKQNHKIQSNVPRRRKSDGNGLFTKEQKTFIKNHVKGLQNQELADLLNKTFGLSITARQMNTWKKNHGQTSGIDKRFKKGHTPVNKGTKGLYNVGGNKTSFKKGQDAHNYRPVGSERVDSDGYLLVKVSDKGPWHKRWRHKHKVLWEESKGPIPKGHVLIFADGNKQNISLNNLLLATNSQLARLNQNHLIFDNPDLTKTGLIIADIYGKIGERKRKEVNR
jgi:hypothetical protein